MEKQISGDEAGLGAEMKALLEESQLPNYTQKLKGILSGFGYVICVVISGASVQLLNRSIPDFELNTIRSAVGLLIICAALTCTGSVPLVPKTEIISTILFSTTCTGSTLTLYIGLSLVPAASAQCTLVTSNIITGIVLFALLCNEKPTVIILLTSAMCTFGLAMVIQKPSTLSTDKYDDDLLSYSVHNNSIETAITVKPPAGSNSTVTTNLLWYIFPILNGLCDTVITVILKRNPFLNQQPLHSLFWSCIMNLIVSVIVMSIFETPVLPQSLFQIALIMIHSTPYVFALGLCMYAAKNISGNTLNMIFSSAIVFMLVAQYTVLSHILPGHRNWIEVVGVLLVTLGSVLTSAGEIISNKSVMGQKTTN